MGGPGSLWKPIGALTTPENGVRLDNLLICKVFKILFKTSLFRIHQVKNLLQCPPPKENKNQPKPFLPLPQNICIAAQGHRTPTKECSALAGGAPETFGGAHICNPLLSTCQLCEQGCVVSISQTGKLRLRKIGDLDLGHKWGAKIQIQTWPDYKADPAFLPTWAVSAGQ